MNDNHDLIREQFSAAFDGDLDPASETAFERALADQPELRREFETFCASIDSLRLAPLEEPGEAHFAAVMQAVESETDARVVPFARRWLVPTAAALLFGIALGIALERRSQHFDPSANGAAEMVARRAEVSGPTSEGTEASDAPVQIVEVPVEVPIEVPVEVFVPVPVVRWIAAPQGLDSEPLQEDSPEAIAPAPARPLFALEIDTEPLARVLGDWAQASEQEFETEPELASIERRPRITSPGPGAPVIASREAGRVVLRERGSRVEVAIALVACLDHGDPEVVSAARERLSDLQASRPEDFRLPEPAAKPERRWWQKAEEAAPAGVESMAEQRDQSWRTWARRQTF